MQIARYAISQGNCADRDRLAEGYDIREKEKVMIWPDLVIEGTYLCPQRRRRKRRKTRRRSQKDP
jgi:hypothetical protein